MALGQTDVLNFAAQPLPDVLLRRIYGVLAVKSQQELAFNQLTARRE